MVHADTPHPLLPILLAAADGAFPPADGLAVLTPQLPDGFQAVVSFTGHAVIATDLTPVDLCDLALDGYGAALQPDVLLRLAGAGGDIGVLDVTLAVRGRGGRNDGRQTLPLREDLDRHPRVLHARRLRQDVRVYADERGLVTLARGLAGRTEMSVELTSDRYGRGAGASLIRDAVCMVPEGELLFAAVAPGNARSLRAFLRVGFVPLGSEVIIGARHGGPLGARPR